MTKVLQIHEEKKKSKTKLWKKIILKDIATKYIEYKHKNTGGSSYKSICISK